MDVHFTRIGLDFVWNTEKAVANVQKHGIRFESATFVFVESFVLIEDASVSGEQRDAVIGLTEDWSLLFVVSIVHQRDAIRIISARPATAQQRRAYEDCE